MEVHFTQAMFVYLWPLTINFKWAYKQITGNSLSLKLTLCLVSCSSCLTGEMDEYVRHLRVSGEDLNAFTLMY